MSIVRPVERDVLATAAADSIVVGSDARARSSSAYFWDRGRPWTSAVIKAVTQCEDPVVRSLGLDLTEEPADPAHYFALRSALVSADAAAVAEICELAWQAECNSRLGYQLGPRYDPGEPTVHMDELRDVPPGTPLSSPGEAEVLIVIPFQDRGAEQHRLRNLLACLLALRDQSSPRERYQVTVVETDGEARWSDVIRPRADHYLFAAKPGPFNKSWTVNVGVTHTPGRPEVICILDADVLVDRQFVERNAARFRRPGTGGHLTYRNMLSLDEPATSHAIRERVSQRKPQPDPDHFRGFMLRRPPGCCVWVRSAAFERIGGMDERYEGWGGEDYDFLHRLDLDTPLDNHDDWLLHMHHPPSAFIREDGGLVDIPPLSWRPTEPIGRMDRFTANGRPG
ncbi:MAG TPA: galactosyltransferase-related protein [Streptosporangiaceae bacterium]